MIETILFDVDGVFLSEDRYFDASALTVWELIYSSHYLGINPSKFHAAFNNQEINRIRKLVFNEDRLLKEYKARGLNANWDMIYLTFSYHLIDLLAQVKEEEPTMIKKWLESEIDYNRLAEMRQVFKKYSLEVDFKQVLVNLRKAKAKGKDLFKELNQFAEEKLGAETSVFKGKSELWSIGEHISQEWYVGDEYVMHSTGRPSIQRGKKGFLHDEKTLGSKEEIKELLEFLSKSSIKLGIGTGRPELETFKPFRNLGWIDYFEENHIATADDVLKTESEFPQYLPLSKPHPFTYLYALKGKETPKEEILSQPLPIRNGKNILIVGDSLADLLAAKKIGGCFAAVLTGLSGKKARDEFEAADADYILDSVLDLKDLLISEQLLEAAPGS